MTIEDINYLYENSTKENIILLVDSGKRDRKLYPHVAEFQINFIEPFNFVYGISILDTTIPRTMFMIEEDINDEFSYIVGYDMFKNYFENINEIRFKPQDFSTGDAFFQAIDSQLYNKFNTSQIIMDNGDDIDTPYIRLNEDYPIPRFTKLEPFFMDMNVISMKTVFGFEQYPRESDSKKYLTFTNVMNIKSNLNRNLSNLIAYKNEKTNNLGIFNVANNSFSLIPLTNVDSISKTLHKQIYKYVHTPEFEMETYLLDINLHSTLLPFETGTEYRVKIYDSFNEIYIFDKTIPTSLYTDTISFLNFRIQNENAFMKFKEDQHLIFKAKTIYYFEIFNVKDIVEEVTIGYSYFVDISEIKNYENIFVSKPILNPDDLFTKYLEFGSYTKEVSDTYDFIIDIDTIDFTERKGFISDLRIYINELDTELDETNDKFILRLYKNIQKKQSLEHEYSIYLSYDYDNDEKEYCLKYTNENMNKSIFSYANVDQSIYYCTLQVKNEMNSQRKVLLLYSDSFDDNNAKNYKINVQLVSKFFLISPGMLNLASQNYIIMRCDEIENHVRGSYDVKDYSPGLGVLNIDVQGYAAGRTDFYSVVYKEFHPIGRLRKLKFRFERKSDGKLYDFKNIDLHFLIAIKFLRPTQKLTFDSFKLNPNYDPNYMGYINNSLEFQEESSTDESDIEDEYFDSKFNDLENELVIRQQNQRRKFQR